MLPIVMYKIYLFELRSNVCMFVWMCVSDSIYKYTLNSVLQVIEPILLSSCMNKGYLKM